MKTYSRITAPNAIGDWWQFRALSSKKVWVITLIGSFCDLALLMYSKYERTRKQSSPFLVNVSCAKTTYGLDIGNRRQLYLHPECEKSLAPKELFYVLRVGRVTTVFWTLSLTLLFLRLIVSFRVSCSFAIAAAHDRTSAQCKHSGATSCDCVAMIVTIFFELIPYLFSSWYIVDCTVWKSHDQSLVSI